MQNNKINILTEAQQFKAAFIQLLEDIKILKNLDNCLKESNDPVDKNFLKYLINTQNKLMFERQLEADIHFGTNFYVEGTEEEKEKAKILYSECEAIGEEIIRIFPEHPMVQHMKLTNHFFDLCGPEITQEMLQEFKHITIKD